MANTEESIAGMNGVPRAVLNLAPSGTVTTPTDTTLSIEGMAADAKATGNAIFAINESIDALRDKMNSEYLKVTAQSLTDAQKAQAQENLGIIDLIYPVGSIYINAYASQDPADLFPGTTWTQIDGKFLVGAGGNYAAGSTGGAQQVAVTPAGTVGGTVLTAEQSGMPAHTHNHAITMPSHTHAFNGQTVSNAKVRVVIQTVASGSGATVNGLSSSGTPTSGLITVNLNGGSVGSPSGGTAICGGTIAKANAQAASQGHTHPFIGNPMTIETMPPFLAVCMWRRTA